jgi:hypothetical protein
LDGRAKRPIVRTGRKSSWGVLRQRSASSTMMFDYVSRNESEPLLASLRRTMVVNLSWVAKPANLMEETDASTSDTIRGATGWRA